MLCWIHCEQILDMYSRGCGCRCYALEHSFGLERENIRRVEREKMIKSMEFLHTLFIKNYFCMPTKYVGAEDEGRII
jgi:hypothetical protein